MRAFGLKKNNVVHQTLLHGNLTYTRVEGTNKGEGPKEVNQEVLNLPLVSE